MNKVVLVGRLTKDPELRFTNTNNTAVASFSVAVDRRFVRQGEERQADFINIVAWGKSAEFVNKYFSKGKLIGLSGRIQSRSWEDESGKRRYATEVVAEEIEFVGSKNESSVNNQSLKNTAPQTQANDGFATVDDDDDELPF